MLYLLLSQDHERRLRATRKGADASSADDASTPLGPTFPPPLLLPSLILQPASSRHPAWSDPRRSSASRLPRVNAERQTRDGETGTQFSRCWVSDHPFPSPPLFPFSPLLRESGRLTREHFPLLFCQLKKANGSWSSSCPSSTIISPLFAVRLDHPLLTSAQQLDTATMLHFLTVPSLVLLLSLLAISSTAEARIPRQNARRNFKRQTDTAAHTSRKGGSLELASFDSYRECVDVSSRPSLLSCSGLRHTSLTLPSLRLSFFVFCCRAVAPTSAPSSPPTLLSAALGARARRLRPGCRTANG